MDEATRFIAARGLLMEGQALEAVRAMAKAGIEVRVVKGLCLQAQLYDQSETRLYSDIDLLVGPGQWNRARAVLGALGYVVAPSGGIYEHPIHSVAFRRGGADGLFSAVDLHHRFHSVRVSSRAFWRIAGADPVAINVGGGFVKTTPLSVTGFHLLVSALPEDGGNQRHVDEWHRFCARYPDAASEVAEVARRWRATNAFDRAIAIVEGRTGRDVPAPLPPKMRSRALSAWAAHLRRAPTLRSRALLIREVCAHGLRTRRAGAVDRKAPPAG